MSQFFSRSELLYFCHPTSKLITQNWFEWMALSRLGGYISPSTRLQSYRPYLWGEAWVDLISFYHLRKCAHSRDSISTSFCKPSDLVLGDSLKFRSISLGDFYLYTYAVWIPSQNLSNKWPLVPNIFADEISSRAPSQPLNRISSQSMAIDLRSQGPRDAASFKAATHFETSEQVTILPAELWKITQSRPIKKWLVDGYPFHVLLQSPTRINKLCNYNTHTPIL